MKKILDYTLHNMCIVHVRIFVRTVSISPFELPLKTCFDFFFKLFPTENTFVQFSYRSVEPLSSAVFVLRQAFIFVLSRSHEIRTKNIYLWTYFEFSPSFRSNTRIFTRAFFVLVMGGERVFSKGVSVYVSTGIVTPPGPDTRRVRRKYLRESSNRFCLFFFSRRFA